MTWQVLLAPELSLVIAIAEVGKSAVLLELSTVREFAHVRDESTSVITTPVITLATSSFVLVFEIALRLGASFTAETLNAKTLSAVREESLTRSVIFADPLAFKTGCRLTVQLTEFPFGPPLAVMPFGSKTDEFDDKMLTELAQLKVESGSAIVNDTEIGVSSAVDCADTDEMVGGSFSGSTVTANVLDVDAFCGSLIVKVTLVVPLALSKGVKMALQFGHVPLKRTALEPLKIVVSAIE